MHALQVGPAVVYPRERRLFVDGAERRIGGRAFDLLMTLLSDPDRTFGADELYESVWADVAVEPNNLAVQLLALRRVLGRDAIVTVPRRGYRLVAPVEPLTAAVPSNRDPGAAPASRSDAGRRAPACAASVADRLVRERWITLWADDPADADSAAVVACALQQRLHGRLPWQLAGGGGVLFDAAVQRRLARTGALVLVYRADLHARVAIARWLATTADASSLRVLATAAPVPSALPGETVLRVQAPIGQVVRAGAPAGHPAADHSGHVLRRQPRP